MIVSETCFEILTAYPDVPDSTMMIHVNAPGLHAEEQYHSNFSIKDDNGGVVNRANRSVPFSECSYYLSN